MCNCGNKRDQWRAQANASQNNYRQKAQLPPAPIKRTVTFQYTGNSALSVTGSITGKYYRFNFPGDIQHVSLNDVSAMAAIPLLKRV